MCFVQHVSPHWTGSYSAHSRCRGHLPSPREGVYETGPQDPDPNSLRFLFSTSFSSAREVGRSIDSTTKWWREVSTGDLLKKDLSRFHVSQGRTWGLTGKSLHPKIQNTKDKKLKVSIKPLDWICKEKNLTFSLIESTSVRISLLFLEDLPLLAFDVDSMFSYVVLGFISRQSYLILV